MNRPPAAVAGCGVISATGAGIGSLADALRDNRSALRAREAFAGKRYQTTVAGWVPEETIAQLAARDPEHADAHAFLLADAALREAGKNLPTVAAGRRALVLSTTKADILAMERVFLRQPCSKPAHRHLLPRLPDHDPPRTAQEQKTTNSRADHPASAGFSRIVKQHGYSLAFSCFTMRAWLLSASHERLWSNPSRC